MVLTADYHTHTPFSHGKGTIMENAIEAKSKGLKELGITDHGFAHPAFGLRNYKLPKMKVQCQNASEQTGVKVLLGIESNIIGTDGTVDLKPKNYDNFDLFVAGIHKFVLYKFKSIFSLATPNLLHSYFKRLPISNRLKKENTRAFVNVIKNNPVDIISHLNFCSFADSVEVAKVARDYGTYIELNSKKTHLSDEEILKISETGVKFLINSDAHTSDRVGEISLIENTLKRINLDKSTIANIDGRLPDFRFQKFKNGAGR